VLGLPTLVYSPPGSLLSTRSTHGRLKMAARKLKAACLRTVFAMQSLQPGACRTIIPPAGRFRLPQFFQARVAHASTVASRCQCYFVPSVKIRCISAASLRETAARRRPGAPQCRTPKVGWLAENDPKPWRKDMWGIRQVHSLAGTRNSPMLCASPSSWHRSRTSAGSSTPSSPSQGRKPCSHIRPVQFSGRAAGTSFARA